MGQLKMLPLALFSHLGRFFGMHVWTNKKGDCCTRFFSPLKKLLWRPNDGKQWQIFGSACVVFSCFTKTTCNVTVFIFRALLAALETLPGLSVRPCHAKVICAPAQKNHCPDSCWTEINKAAGRCYVLLTGLGRPQRGLISLPQGLAVDLLPGPDSSLHCVVGVWDIPTFAKCSHAVCKRECLHLSSFLRHLLIVSITAKVSGATGSLYSF